MKTKIVKEQPLYAYYGYCADYDWGACQRIELYRKDLEAAKLGDKWGCEDQDCYPNRTRDWTVTAEVVYRTDRNVYLHCYDSIGDYDELIAVELEV